MPTRALPPRAEAATLLRIALPLAAAYLAEYAMFLTTKLVVGRQGYEALAAVGLAGSITFEILVVAMGGLSVVGVLVAQAEGGARRGAGGHAARQGLLLATVVSVPVAATIWHLASAFEVLGQDPVVVALARPYLHALAWGTLPVLWFSVLRGFVAALAHTAAVMVITVTAVGLNFVLTVGLVEGRFGLPALGLAGAGWSTSAVAWVMVLALAAHIHGQPALRGHGLFAGRLRIDPRVGAEIVRLGLPVAGLVFLEGALFAAVSLLSGVLGADVLAAYEILSAWVGISFVLALGVAEATMVRVAHGVGTASPGAARQAGFVGMGLGIAMVGCLLVVPLAYPEFLLHAFLDVADPGFGRVSAIVLDLFVIVAVFQVFDGLQASAARALRGARDTYAPLWIASFGYWVIGIGGGCALTFGLGLGARGLWWGLAAGLITTATMLTWRFETLTRRTH